MSSEHIFSGALTIALLAGGAVAFGSDLVAPHRTRAAVAVASVTLPTVTITGRRVPAAAQATLPTVVVVGHRVQPTTLAAATRSDEQRVR